MRLPRMLRFSPVLTILTVAMMAVALACAGDDATPTSPPTATSPAPTATAPSGPAATAPAGATATAVPATATAVPEVDLEDLPWIERLTQSPGYQPEWGTPQTGGVFKFGQPLAWRTAFAIPACCRNGFLGMPIFNSLLSFEPWVGLNADTIIGELAKSWEMSGDGLSVTMQLREGVMFHENPNVPAEYKGGKISGDEFVCEDVGASLEWLVRPPEWETSLSIGTALLGHLGTVDCPDGERGHTVVLNFDRAKAKTMNSLAVGYTLMYDKDWLEWWTTEHPGGMRPVSNENFLRFTGTGAFMPVELRADVMGKTERNPSYWKEGLPLVDGMEVKVIPDNTTRFTALATGQIHLYGEGGRAMLSGQVSQAIRDFEDTITIHAKAHSYGRGIEFNVSRPPFDDRRVRQAINLALDRSEWLEYRKAGPYEGAYVVGTLFPNTYWSHSTEELMTWPGIRQPKDQDIKYANELLDEVWGKGNRSIELDLITSNTMDYLEPALFYQDQITKNLGIKVNLEVMESAVRSGRTVGCNFMFNSGTDGWEFTGDPDVFFFGFWTHIDNPSASRQCRAERLLVAEPELYPEIIALMAAQSDEMDPVKRQAMTRELDWRMDQELVGQAGSGWLGSYIGTHVSLKGYFLVHHANSRNNHIFERVWITN